MLTPAIFGISNSGVNLAIDLIILFLVVIWLALVYWTWADARRRIADPLLIGCATAASLFPFVGTLVYMIVRPPEYLEDVRERELEIQAAEARLAELGYHLCPHCDYEVEKDFLRCPNCMRKLRDPCPSCGKPLDPKWKICPFCEADLGAGTPTPRRTRRRRERDPLLDRPVAGYGEAAAPRGVWRRGQPEDRRRAAGWRVWRGGQPEDRCRAAGWRVWRGGQPEDRRLRRARPAAAVAGGRLRRDAHAAAGPRHQPRRAAPGAERRRARHHPSHLRAHAVRPDSAAEVGAVPTPAAMPSERTLILVKPDAFARSLTGE